MGSPYTWFFIAFCIAGSAVVLTPLAIPVVLALGAILIMVAGQDERDNG